MFNRKRPEGREGEKEKQGNGMREKSVEALNSNYDQMFVSFSARVSTHRREDCC